MSSTSKNRRNHRGNLHKKGKEIDTDDNLFDLPYLPTPIVLDILSRLQIKPLFNCNLVCKRWASIISTSEFSQLHLLRSPTNCLIKASNISDGYRPNVLQLLDPEYPCRLENMILFKPMINFPNVPTRLLNSCNGLVCLADVRCGVCNIYVCNPLLKEYLTLPDPPVDKQFCTTECIFGFSQKTNRYKVVVSDDKSNNMIYTCGEGSWKSIGSSPYNISNYSYDALVNGRLHWMSYYSNEDRFIICCFDFDSEQFHVVPEPSEFHRHEREHSDRTRIVLFNGNLSIFCSKFPVCDGVVIWVMKNYGVKESWCKDIVINCMFEYFNDGLVELEPIMVKGNGEILMICNYEFLILYDTISKTFRSKQRFSGEDFEFDTSAYTPSLISLKDVAKGENIKVSAGSKTVLAIGPGNKSAVDSVTGKQRLLS